MSGDDDAADSFMVSDGYLSGTCFFKSHEHACLAAGGAPCAQHAVACTAGESCCPVRLPTCGARACTHPNLPCCAADEGVQLEGLDEDDGEMMEVDVTGAWYTTRSVSWV